HRIAYGIISPAYQQVDASLRIPGPQRTQDRHTHQNIPDPFQTNEQDPRGRRQVKQVLRLGGHLAGERAMTDSQEGSSPAEFQRFQSRRHRNSAAENLGASAAVTSPAARLLSHANRVHL